MVSTASIPNVIVFARHFPPAVGGIQTFTSQLLSRLDPDRLVLVTARAGQHDFSGTKLKETVPTVRANILPSLANLRSVVRAHQCEVAWIPAAAPYGGLASALKRAGVRHVVASTHGQEFAWMTSSASRAALSRLLRSVDVLTYLGAFTRSRLKDLAGDWSLQRLAGGVDAQEFPCKPASTVDSHPPTVVMVSRFVPRKGHDRLFEAWPSVLRAVPDARLVLVGDGVTFRRWQWQSTARPYRGSVRLTGRLPHAALLRELHRATVFVNPCRDFLQGRQVEGLGLATLEASATGLPVVVGRSGGSPDSLIPRRTGLLVDANQPAELAGALIRLLLDREAAAAFGAEGAAWVRRSWTWEAGAQQLERLLSA